MKKRMTAVLLCVIMGMSLWNGRAVLWNGLGTATASFVLARGQSVIAPDPLEGQGYSNPFFAVKQKASQSPTVKTVNLSMDSGKYSVISGLSVKNGTEKSVDVSALLKEGFTKPTFSDDQPAVLIYHTHTTEGYAETGGGYTSDNSHNVVAVGEAMKEIFEKNGLKTIHLTDNYIDGGSFKTAYTRSLKGVEAVLKKYPSIQIVLDVHRDSIADGTTQYCPLTTIDDEQYAQIMLICGSDQLGMKHPQWKENFKYALALAKQLQNTYPSLTRPVNLNANRYNTHTTKYALLVEVGSGTNTTEQALRSGRAVADGICKIVK